MSAGTGLTHSEYNNSAKDDVTFLQIWVFPKEKQITPRYGQLRFDAADRHNRFQVVVSPQASDATIWINQDAWFSMVNLDAGKQTRYQKKREENGVYYFVLEGQVNIDGHAMARRDGLGLTQGDNSLVRAETDVELLAIEVPMA